MTRESQRQAPAASQPALNIQFLLTGTELMVGDIVDTNSVMLAQSLKDQGAELTRKVTLGDDFKGIVAEIEHMSLQADVLIINGGLGPTEDDLTAEAIAQVIGQPLEENSEALIHLEAWCKKRGFQLEGANRKQVVLPKGISLVANRMGSAVGFSAHHNNCLIICTPGVPSELKVMWAEEILPLLKSQLPIVDKVKTIKFHVFGIGESAIQNLFDRQLANWPKEIEVGYRAASPLVELKFTTRSEQAELLLPQWQAKVEQLLGAHILRFLGDWAVEEKIKGSVKGIIKDSIKGLTEGPEQPASVAKCLVELLARNKQTMTAAESCTGGLIASNITRIPGSSQVFEAGYVTYSNRIKSQLLNVKEQTLLDHGAVSESVVIEMAQGALAASSADWAVAVSGIAGPDGGSEEKPLGTVWLCWGKAGHLKTKCLVYPSTRINFQRFIANVGLDLIRREILEAKDEPSYFSRNAK
ncbi:MAG: nicotinamide-nucleotide amidohydrolase family protein [Oleispira antarctica]|nr:nicotinamide-nucleotide amidohydrolase family protein [Oleispira antarctica]MBQ0792479.1 nicotinamide-nucleotide amidohydrolase family protein [Oleispira antarctica]